MSSIGGNVKNEKTVNEKWKSVNEKWKSVNEKWKTIKLDYTRQFEKVENRTSKEAGRMKQYLVNQIYRK